MADNPDDTENIIQNYNNAVVDWITAQIIDMIVGTVKTCSTGLDEQNHHYLRAVGLEELVVKFFANLKGSKNNNKYKFMINCVFLRVD